MLLAHGIATRMETTKPTMNETKKDGSCMVVTTVVSFDASKMQTRTIKWLVSKPKHIANIMVVQSVMNVIKEYKCFFLETTGEST